MLQLSHSLAAPTLATLIVWSSPARMLIRAAAQSSDRVERGSSTKIESRRRRRRSRASRRARLQLCLDVVAPSISLASIFILITL